MKPIVFLGSNYNLNQMTDIASAMGREVIGILDSDYFGNCADICGIPVIGDENTFSFTNDYDYFLAINWGPGRTYTRNRSKHEKISKLINDQKLSCINLIHPTAIVPGTVSLGQGNMICAYSVIGNHTVIGDFCQVREQSYVAHNSKLYNNVVIQVQSYVGSNIQIESNCYLAVKSTIVSQGDVGGILSANTFIKTSERKVL